MHAAAPMAPHVPAGAQPAGNDANDAAAWQAYDSTSLARNQARKPADRPALPFTDGRIATPPGGMPRPPQSPIPQTLTGVDARNATPPGGMARPPIDPRQMTPSGGMLRPSPTQMGQGAPVRPSSPQMQPQMAPQNFGTSTPPTGMQRPGSEISQVGASPLVNDPQLGWNTPSSVHRLPGEGSMTAARDPARRRQLQHSRGPSLAADPR